MSEEAVRLMSFTSGSCGNAAWIGLPDGTGILIDAGVSVRRLRKELRERGGDPAQIAAVLVTHDHLDHIRHLGSWCKHLGIPVWATPTLHAALAHHPFTRDTIAPCRMDLAADAWNPVAPGFEVRYTVVPHDATETVGFAIRAGGHRITWLTDLGEMTPEATAFAKEADTLVIESNYDPDLLMGGQYTYVLKMRISQGGHGHLSNGACAEALRDVWHPGLRNVFLCHLSGNNNTPSMALSCASAALRIAADPTAHPTALRYFPRQYPTPMFTL